MFLLLQTVISCIFIVSATAGYIVYKSVPFGPLSSLLPYLSRRAAENRVVLQGTRKEQELLRSELSRRFYGITDKKEAATLN